MTASIPELLEQALASKVRLHLSCSPEGFPLCFAAKAVGVTEDGGGVTILPELKACKLLDRLTSAATPIRASFVTQHGEAFFETRVIRHTKAHWLTEQVVVEAGVIAMPEGVNVHERRQAERFRMHDAGGIYASLLIMLDGERVKIANTIWDISLGGVSFVAPFNKNMLALKPGRTALVVLDCFGQQTKIIGKLVQVRRLSQQTLRFGLQFVDPNEAVHTTLENVIAELAHRREVRHAHPAA
jgi:c-di-GMP-binding flagellar brake protein YcgR